MNSTFKNNYFTEMCSGSEAGSYATIGLRVIKEKKKMNSPDIRGYVTSPVTIPI